MPCESSAVSVVTWFGRRKKWTISSSQVTLWSFLYFSTTSTLSNGDIKSSSTERKEELTLQSLHLLQPRHVPDLRSSTPRTRRDQLRIRREPNRRYRTSISDLRSQKHRCLLRSEQAKKSRESALTRLFRRKRATRADKVTETLTFKDLYNAFLTSRIFPTGTTDSAF